MIKLENMTMNTTLRFGCRLISLFILTSFLIYGWKIVYISFQVMLHSRQISIWETIYFVIITSLLIMLNGMVAYGLFYIKKWSFILAYFSIVFSTIFYSYPYVPFIGKITNYIFCIEHKSITLTIINFIVICYVIYLHWLFLRSDKYVK